MKWYAGLFLDALVQTVIPDSCYFKSGITPSNLIGTKNLFTEGIEHIDIILWDRNSPWGLHQMETFSASLAICAGNSAVTGEFPSQRPVTWSTFVMTITACNICRFWETIRATRDTAVPVQYLNSDYFAGNTFAKLDESTETPTS